MSRVEKFLSDKNEGLETAHLEVSKYLEKELGKFMSDSGFDKKDTKEFVGMIADMMMFDDGTMSKFPGIIRKAYKMFDKHAEDETTENFLEAKSSVRRIKGMLRESLKETGSAAIRALGEVSCERIDKMMDEEDYDAPCPKDEKDHKLLKEAYDNMKSAARKLRRVKEEYKKEGANLGKMPTVVHTKGDDEGSDYKDQD